jgi:hypothetical protein
VRHVPGGEAEEILPRRYVVDSKTETIDRRWGAGVGRVGRFVSARGVKPHTGVGGDFCSLVGGVSIRL